MFYRHFVETLYQTGKVIFYSKFVRDLLLLFGCFLNFEWVGFCQKPFSVSTEILMWFLFYVLWYIGLIDFRISNQTWS